jgi:hypothetical protein
MIDSVALRWILTLTFAAIGVYYLVRCVQASSTWVLRVSCIAHLAMSAAMIAMVWPWGMNIPVGPQVAVFVLAALWFLPLAWSREGAAIRVLHLHHVVIMGAMAWMVGSMPTVMSGSGSDMPQAMDMSHGMSMPGMGGNSSAVPGYLTVVSIVLACYFAAYTFWLISHAVGPLKAGHTEAAQAKERSCQGIMSVGMAVMLLAVL